MAGAKQGDAAQGVKVEGVVSGIAPDQKPPMYGRAVWNVVTIMDRPDMKSIQVGYLRKGAVVVVDEEKTPDKTAGGAPYCKKGWWRIVDGGGYVCSTKGIEAGRDLLPSNLYPVPASVDSAMPYAYAHVMSDFTPLYERFPTEVEETEVEAWAGIKKKEFDEKIAALKEQAARKAQKAKDKDKGAGAGEGEGQEGKEAGDKGGKADIKGDGGAGEEAGAGGEGSSDVAGVSAGAVEKASAGAVATASAGDVPLIGGAKQGASGKAGAGEEAGPGEAEAEGEGEDGEEGTDPFDFVKLFMLKGFYVSLDREMVDRGVKWYRTVKGQFVKSAKIMPVNIRTRGGAQLAPDFAFPAGIVLREEIYERVWNSKHNHIVKNKDVLYPKFTVLQIFGKQVDKVNDIDAIYYEVDPEGGKMVLSWSVVPVSKAEPRPPEVPEGGKWVHVDISDQTLVAYEGDTPVFLTLISSGKEKESEEFKTPRGTFTVQSKHVSGTMDNLALDDTSYSIEDVPWTMYFSSNYALHGAFWHSMFGHQRSHGCVNMTPQDAKWIFDWSEPRLPLGWHGVVATADRPGTFVKITD